MLIPIGPEIWTAEGPRVTGGMGFHYPTRMAVLRLTDGTVLVWSPVALDGGLQSAVDALGPVTNVIAPNSLHHTFLAKWQAAYPDALFWAAPGLREQRADVVFAGELGEVAPAGWERDIEQVVVAGNSITTEVVFFHKASRTAIFTDLIQHLPRDWYGGWRALVARLDLMTAAEPSVPRKFRIAFRDRRAARKAVDTILTWPIERVVMAHGALVHADGHALVKRAFGWLRP